MRLTADDRWQGELSLEQFLRDIVTFLRALCVDIARFAPAIFTYESDAILRLHMPGAMRFGTLAPLSAVAPADHAAYGFHWDLHAVDWEQAAHVLRESPPYSSDDRISVRYALLSAPVRVVRDGEALVLREPLMQGDPRARADWTHPPAPGSRFDPNTERWPLFDLALQLVERITGDTSVDDIDANLIWYGIRGTRADGWRQPRYIRRGLLDEIAADLGPERFVDAGHAFIMSFLRALSYHLPAASTLTTCTPLRRYLADRTP